MPYLAFNWALLVKHQIVKIPVFWKQVNNNIPVRKLCLPVEFNLWYKTVSLVKLHDTYYIELRFEIIVFRIDEEAELQGRRWTHSWTATPFQMVYFGLG